MKSKKIVSLFLISTLAACASGSGGDGPSKRSPEERCMELEHKWDVAQQELTAAEKRADSSWLYHMADSFNPLTNSSDESLERARSNEQRAHQNYLAFGCLELNKRQISAVLEAAPAISSDAGQRVASYENMNYQAPSQN